MQFIESKVDLSLYTLTLYTHRYMNILHLRSIPSESLFDAINCIKKPYKSLHLMVPFVNLDSNLFLAYTLNIISFNKRKSKTNRCHHCYTPIQTNTQNQSTLTRILSHQFRTLRISHVTIGVFHAVVRACINTDTHLSLPLAWNFLSLSP